MNEDKINQIESEECRNRVLCFNENIQSLLIQIDELIATACQVFDEMKGSIVSRLRQAKQDFVRDAMTLITQWTETSQRALSYQDRSAIANNFFHSLGTDLKHDLKLTNL